MTQDICLTIDIDTTTWTGLYAPNRWYLLGYLQGIAVPIVITMPCGSELKIEAPEDIPLKTLACSCGNPKHHFVRYQEDE